MMRRDESSAYTSSVAPRQMILLHPRLTPGEDDAVSRRRGIGECRVSNFPRERAPTPSYSGPPARHDSTRGGQTTSANVVCRFAA